MTCPDCGLPLVPYGGEDICLQMCERCERHDCDCDDGRERDDENDE